MEIKIKQEITRWNSTTGTKTMLLNPTASEVVWPNKLPVWTDITMSLITALFALQANNVTIFCFGLTQVTVLLQWGGICHLLIAPFCLFSANRRRACGISRVSQWRRGHWSLWAELRWVRLVIFFFYFSLVVSVCLRVSPLTRMRSRRVNEQMGFLVASPPPRGWASLLFTVSLY